MLSDKQACTKSISPLFWNEQKQHRVEASRNFVERVGKDEKMFNNIVIPTNECYQYDSFTKSQTAKWRGKSEGDLAKFEHKVESQNDAHNFFRFLRD